MPAHTPTSETLGGAEPGPGRRHEVLGILALAATILMSLSLWSYDANGGENLVGPVGTGVASVFASAFGVAAWLLPMELAFLTTRLFSRRETLLGVATIASTVVIVFAGCAMVHLIMVGEQVFGGHMPGGALGELLGEVLRSLFGLAGAYVVCTTILLVTLVLRTPVSFVEAMRRTRDFVESGVERVRESGEALVEAWREAKALEEEEREARALAEMPSIVPPFETERTHPGVDDEAAAAEDDHDTADGALIDAEEPAAAPAVVEALDEEDDEPLEEEDEVAEAPVAKAKRPSKAPRASAPKKPKKGESSPKIVVPQHMMPNGDRVVVDEGEVEERGEFTLPPTTLMDEPPPTMIKQDPAELTAMAQKLVKTLEDYKIKGRVDEIHPGPVVTMFEFEPSSGTKLSRIRGLADDLAMALAVEKVRIVAPIPGKARVGFELPNRHRQTVYIREILETRDWADHKGHLPVAFGKDIAGKPVYGDLARMPHLLVAGATGAGKSVGLNVMLASLLYKKTPEEVRMLMIDPKVVELAVFDGIPHMLLPVVTDMSKAALALKWAVEEMERRYQLFADAGTKNIITFNKKVTKVLDGDLPIEKFMPRRKGKVKAQGANGQEVLLDPSDGETPDACDITPEKLPYVVVVVDEFADLMMVSAKDVETCIARLAQKARAAGIHVILATQRPSVDVITGMIKANFPSRIAFKVSSAPDSKTILNRQGAEHLLGRGDMLMVPPGSSDLHRVHSAFIDEHEVEHLCNYLREQGQPVYDEDILRPRDEDEGYSGPQTDDPLYDKAVAIVAQEGQCSISRLQRKLKIGYNKAANLVEKMEEEGVVGPPSAKAGGRREVLVQAH